MSFGLGYKHVPQPFNRRSREDAISRRTWNENVTKPDEKRDLTFQMHTLRIRHPTLTMEELIYAAPKKSFYPDGP